MNKDIEEILYSEEQLHLTTGNMAKLIDNDYKDILPLLVGILNGVVPFMVSLVNQITIPMNMDFIKVKSYSGVHSTGNVQIIGYVPDVKGKDIILVDDILDTGNTLYRIRNL